MQSTEDAGSGADAAALAMLTDPAAPTLGPCPSGWTATSIEGAASSACMPWTDAGPTDCPAGSVWFAGAGACQPVGRACPAGRYPPPEALPPGNILYVDATNGSFSGDGSSGNPFFFIDDALRVATAGTVIVLARGSYDEQVVLRDGVSLIGACAAETIITAPAFTDEEIPVATGVISVVGSGVHVGGVTLTGRRIGLRVEPTGVAADVSIEGVIIDSAAYVGLLASFGGQAHGSDLVVRSTQGIGGRVGGGIVAGGGGSATLSRVVVLDNATAGVDATRGGRVELSSAVVRGTRPYPDARYGRGLNVAQGMLTISDSWVGDNSECGFAVDDGSMRADDLVVAGDPTANGRFACGGFVRGASSLSGERIWIHHVENHALTATVGASIALSDVILSDVRPSPGELLTGWALAADTSGQIAVTRASIVRASGVAVSVDGGGHVELDDVSIVATRAHEATGRGYGVQLDGASSLIGHRIRIEDSLGAALVAFDAGSTVALEDVSVRGSVPGACTDCMAGLGAGIASVRGSDVEVQRFRIEGAACGVQVIDGTEVDMSIGVIADNEIGACIQSPDFDVARISNGVIYGGGLQRNIDRSDRGTMVPAVPGVLSGT